MNKNTTSRQLLNFFDGRIGILDYWIGMLLAFIIFIISINLFSDIDLIFGLSFLFYFFLQLSFSIRRAHDLNYSGWFVLLEFIPLINIYIIIKLLFIRGSSNTNEYGEKSSNNQSASKRIKNLFYP